MDRIGWDIEGRHKARSYGESRVRKLRRLSFERNFLTFLDYQKSFDRNGKDSEYHYNSSKTETLCLRPWWKKLVVAVEDDILCRDKSKVLAHFGIFGLSVFLYKYETFWKALSGKSGSQFSHARNKYNNKSIENAYTSKKLLFETSIEKLKLVVKGDKWLWVWMKKNIRNTFVSETLECQDSDTRNKFNYFYRKILAEVTFFRLISWSRRQNS